MLMLVPTNSRKKKKTDNAKMLEDVGLKLESVTEKNVNKNEMPNELSHFSTLTNNLF